MKDLYSWIRRSRTGHKAGGGFTTLEIVLVVGLFALIVTTVVPLFKNLVGTWEAQDQKLEAVQISRVGLDKMIRELKTATAFTTAESDKVEFKDWDDDDIEYELVTGVLTRNGDAMAGSFDSLQFTYYDSDGNETTDALCVYSVKVTMAVSDAEDKLSEPVTFTSRATMRKDPTGSFALAITEINYNPPDFPKGKKKTVAERKVEWIEVYNYGNTEIDMEDWTIEDLNDSDKIKKAVGTFIVPAGGYGLIAAKNHEVDSHYTVDPGAARLELNDQAIGDELDDAGDTLTIKDADGRTVDTVTYAGSWSTKGNTIERIDPESDPSEETNWEASDVHLTYTPGDENTV
ncbi:MAG: lamin tail domain-containing protein [Candidatus Omnitrophica bacterium]|nr:lamin tail domain-containing protein [Candidatus Omnitrophota bacterium]MBU1656875.1 lamin tail domain-containing protein [Candidatus Omnitrophota bacterium]